jgi:fumarate reductase (CoM/CoB) subunit A
MMRKRSEMKGAFVKTLTCDVLVVGTGGAGCRAALSAAGGGADVILMAKGQMGRCELTAMTMPGFGAMLPSNPRDSLHNFFLDTIDGGAYLNDRDLVWRLAEGSEEAITFLEGLGVRFDRRDDGTFMFYSGVEHTRTGTPRQLAVDDCMGRAFYNALSGEIGRSGIRLLEDVFAGVLVTDEDRVRGLVALDMRRGELFTIWAKVVVLATGGLVGLYQVRTGHPRDTGDGHALALRAGVALKDMEFVQSNPAAFFYPESIRGVVVPGWYLVMDRGAKYYNGQGQEFLHHYDPERRENTTRDIKARAIQLEILAGRASEHGGVYLDFTQVNLDAPLEDYLSENAPFLLGYLRHIGLPPDVIFARPMEVGPAAHYSCGGISIDDQTETSLPGLLAAGEVTGGVHGANRLGNNAMADIFVFGKIAGERAAELAHGLPGGTPPVAVEARAAAEAHRLEETLSAEPGHPVRPAELRAEIEAVMSTLVGFGRDQAGLEQAVDRLAALREEGLPRLATPSHSRTVDYDLVEMLELANLVDVGETVARAALARTETRGCHNRLDHLAQNDRGWLVHLLVRREGRDWHVERSPVRVLQNGPSWTDTAAATAEEGRLP